MTEQQAALLTQAERDRLQHLIRRAARHLGAEERGALLRLWERQQANRGPEPFEARMTLHMSDCDPIATCACGVRCFGDSINDALIAWGKHLTTAHANEEW